MKRSPILMMTSSPSGEGKDYPQTQEPNVMDELVEKVCSTHHILGYAHKDFPEKVLCGECFSEALQEAVNSMGVMHGTQSLSVPCFACGNHKPIMVWADNQYFCSDCCPEKK